MFRRHGLRGRLVGSNVDGNGISVVINIFSSQFHQERQKFPSKFKEKLFQQAAHVRNCSKGYYYVDAWCPSNIKMVGLTLVNCRTTLVHSKKCPPSLPYHWSNKYLPTKTQQCSNRSMLRYTPNLRNLCNCHFPTICEFYHFQSISTNCQCWSNKLCYVGEYWMRSMFCQLNMDCQCIIFLTANDVF